ncbi:unnamed protein product [Microthlaspi erraticum]|uniref:Uncharacterized protein n=1 Tax=Microthlaspi erraticum TaxID=1685480 RepID=A0A6D2K3L5_9BRAS|nr:unnamed protein product [Microthlaspi erraticum]
MTNSEGSLHKEMVEGESSNARERRLKMQADLKRMDQRMEESDAEGYVSDETESEEEGEEVNQLVDEDDQEGNQDEPMEELSHKSSKRRRRTPYVPRALQCPLLHGLHGDQVPTC